ncbi:DUF6340 family protein [Maribacter sp. HTCC2170]|uniref:DUF6340 family protein n=1 Tax=Maribacter sp. (strain HTCC2170 / KCCM 42371) TaxID=313603 RepID=UPI00006AFCD7|nr:DUF6340 family protein [Maribacter sp. HTCC2170]EAR01430.1 hypothetical protein FB2170_11936 [Maribacter sp. HTCC2170]
MKSHYQTLLYTLIALFLVGCSATNNLTMSAVEPAPITLSKDVKRVGIINRSLPSEGNKTADKIDKILSAEGLNLDEHGSEAAILALKEQLEQNKSIEEVLILDDLVHLRKGLSVFPSTMTWNEIETLCEEYKVDAIFSLAFYDTDTKVNFKMTSIDLPNDLGVKVAVPAHELTLNTLIENGWRVYDPYSKRIADELVFSDHVVSVGKGINPIKAYEAILGRKEAVLHQSKYMGIDYAQRLLPYKHRVNRDYFVRGSDNFKIAQRRAQAGDWDGAANLWSLETGNPDPKVAGRACYNMAISNEINGNLDDAMQWASKSYVDYKNNYALSYLNTLKYRARQKAVLNQQLSK